MSLEESDIEIVVTAGNWQIAGRPPRWNWQVRRKHPSKLLAKGVAMGERQNAYATAKVALSKFLARQQDQRAPGD